MLQYLPMINWAINVGDLLQAVAIIGAGIGMFYAMRSDLRVLRHDVRAIEIKQEALNEGFTQLGQILTKVAVQDTRLNMMERYIDELRHGHGFITKKL